MKKVVGVIILLIIGMTIVFQSNATSINKSKQFVKLGSEEERDIYLETKDTSAYVPVQDENLNYDYIHMSLEAIFDEYINQRNLAGEIAIGYYNFETQEVYKYNSETYMNAASLYKLPLNMDIYDEINAGKVDGMDTIVLNEFHFSECSTTDVYIGGSYSLMELTKNSILYSDNVSSYALFDYLGGWKVYRERTTKYSQTVSYSMEYCENMYTVDYMIDVLKYLYTHQEEYSVLIEQMSKVSPKESLGKYIDVVVAQKEGWLGENWNAAGITYGNQPYAAAIFTSEGALGSDICGEINYILYMHSRYSK